ncbi:predicted protein [Sclerotinia sclerotiorum 1980 UF-70]|uniref:Uncharacterized protein n=2 Tax=Sclerotinia sclerotiorum (strain ATCC 18683 / 1980 / Ss-1) TaxID=665079 RepID=A7F3M6_SCLS1|nr:predicted protein [Sclerotinia sclerotiorum 1980 UF-70]APA14314.1 hypothetical protein sscle_12g090840 [Sclerotinia sclerotiorum 1980 UF-70]EDN97347.1 predicted protein [Sclerotinia sclerotiorum 1980 UF-70]
MAAPEALPSIARHLLRFNHQSKIPFQTSSKSLYHHKSHVKSHVAPIVNGLHVSISARIAASKGDRERILKSIERAREAREKRDRGLREGMGGVAVGMGVERKIWEEQVYPPVGGLFV